MEGEQPKRQCEKHKMAAAPDGKCFLCRKEAPQSENVDDDTETIGMGRIIKSNLLVVALGVAIYFAMTTKSSSTPVPQGPSLDEQIEVVDAQLKELRAARAAGGLDGNGLQALSRAETKRTILVAARTARDNR
jgi:hypothetical protein